MATMSTLMCMQLCKLAKMKSCSSAGSVLALALPSHALAALCDLELCLYYRVISGHLKLGLHVKWALLC